MEFTAEEIATLDRIYSKPFNELTNEEAELLIRYKSTVAAMAKVTETMNMIVSDNIKTRIEQTKAQIAAMEARRRERGIGCDEPVKED